MEVCNYPIGPTEFVVEHYGAQKDPGNSTDDEQNQPPECKEEGSSELNSPFYESIDEGKYHQIEWERYSNGSYHDNCFYFEIDPCKEHVMHPNHETLDSDENKGCDKPFSSNNSFACERLENLCHCTEGWEKYDIDLRMAKEPEQVGP